jgi:hypothetical protein
LVLAVLILAAPIDAKPEKITLGQYKVSFDMGDVGAYSINIEPPRTVMIFMDHQ